MRIILRRIEGKKWMPVSEDLASQPTTLTIVLEYVAMKLRVRNEEFNEILIEARNNPEINPDDKWIAEIWYPEGFEKPKGD